MIGRLSRVAGLLAVGAIIVLSLVPGSGRPHTGLAGSLEHCAAYAVAGGLLGLGWPLRTGRILFALVALGALLEVLQLWVPGRSAEVIGALSSGLGGLIGTGAAGFLAPRLKLAGIETQGGRSR